MYSSGFAERVNTVTSAKNLSRDVIIRNELGLHARSAAKITQIVQSSKAGVWIKKGNDTADASSIVDILTLACEKGSKITLIIENPSDIDILKALASLVERGFGE
jgi:phosphocarrier protein HPr